MQIEFEAFDGGHLPNPDFLAGYRSGLDTVMRQARMHLLKHHYTIPLLPEHVSLSVVIIHYLEVLRYDQAALVDLVTRWQTLRHAAYRKCHAAGLSAGETQSAQGFLAATERACLLLQRMIQ
jgi:hypothetical protein